jgi:thiol:disulfide interchange protein
MGVLLIALGGFLLWAQINHKAALDLVIRWWPLILLLLGGEILWYAYAAKEEAPKIKYDFFSIFIIFFIVLTSLGLYSLNYIGVIPRLSMMVSARSTRKTDFRQRAVQNQYHQQRASDCQ